jgi:hypothetical protein
MNKDTKHRIDEFLWTDAVLKLLASVFGMVLLTFSRLPMLRIR